MNDSRDETEIPSSSLHVTLWEALDRRIPAILESEKRLGSTQDEITVSEAAFGGSCRFRALRGSLHASKDHGFVIFVIQVISRRGSTLGVRGGR